MKRVTPWLLAVAVFAAILALTAQSVQITAGPEVTLLWDPVTTMEGGVPIPAGDIVSYEVMLDDTVFGSTEEIWYDLTLPNQGQHTFAVRTILTRQSGDIARSDYATLSVIILYRPSRPQRLRVEEQR